MIYSVYRGTCAWMASCAMVLSASSGAWAHSDRKLCDFMPDNNLHFEDDVLKVASITEEEFATITDSIVDIYKPLAQIHGAELSAIKSWTDNTVNAVASQRGNKW